MNDRPQNPESIQSRDSQGPSPLPGGPAKIGPGNFQDHPGPRRGLLAEIPPFGREDFRRAILRPHLVIEYVLGGNDRLSRNLSGGTNIWPLAGLLLATSVLPTMPYGAVSPVGSFWKVAVLFTGSLFICFPSLHVFAQFLGFKLDLARNLALSLVITAAAGLFTFAFSPIIWFIDCTVRADAGALISTRDLSQFLLTFSLFMGIIQMARCLAMRIGPKGETGPLFLLILCWLPLLLFITYRMASVLGIR